MLSNGTGAHGGCAPVPLFSDPRGGKPGGGTKSGRGMFFQFSRTVGAEYEVGVQL